MSEISKEVLKDIEEKKIAPRSRWFFFLKNYLIWFLFLVFLILSSLALSTILFLLTTQDWDVYDYLGRSFLEHVFLSLPYLWIIIFSLLILLLYYDFSHTKHGYKHAIWHTFIISFILSLVLGTVLFLLDVDSEIHETFSKKLPFYNDLIYYKEDIWDKPERGLLAGEILEVENNNDFTLRDFQGRIWHIEGKNISWPDDLIPQKGLKIKIIGQEESNDVFLGKTCKCWDVF